MEMSKKIGWSIIIFSLCVLLIFEIYLLGISYVLPQFTDYEGYAKIEAPLEFELEHTPDAYVKLGIIHKEDAERIRNWNNTLIFEGRPQPF